ncbi:hypothetical protein FKM82_027117 [Ascaphus truei]
MKMFLLGNIVLLITMNMNLYSAGCLPGRTPMLREHDAAGTVAGNGSGVGSVGAPPVKQVAMPCLARCQSKYISWKKRSGNWESR